MKKKNVFIVIFIFTILGAIILTLGNYIFNKQTKLFKIFDHVYDLGDYKTLNYSYAKEFYKNQNDNWGGKCSAVAKNLENGDTIVGRNMDLNISNKNAYIFRTKLKDCHETINLVYTFRDYSPDDSEVQRNGISQEFRDIVPFMADDVLNDAGLYMEINMRHGEFNEDGTSRFSCSGTNPESKERVHVFMLPRYVGDHCSNIDEALAYLKTLDIYTKDGYWNYCFMLADATGRYGVLEIAQNKLFWNEGQQSQTNFYVTPELHAIQEYKIGLGRYETLLEGINNVKNEDDMLKLMQKVNYYNFYSVDTCEFNVLSECSGEEIPIDEIENKELREFLRNHVNVNGITTEQIYSDKVRDLMYEFLKEQGKYVLSLTRQEQQDKNEFWESSFTEVINCNKKTLKVRFFENDEKIITLRFNS